VREDRKEFVLTSLLLAQLQLRIDSFADISQKRDYVGRLPVGLGNPTDQPGY